MTAIHTYIQMQRLKWHCHSTVAGALYEIIVSNSCSAVFRRRTHETVSSSVPGGTADTMKRPWQTTAGHSRHVPLPPGRRGHQVWRVDMAADRSRWRAPTSADFWRVSARYEGALPLRQWCTRTHNRNWILSGTRNQCSSRRSGAMCYDFLAENTKRAAAFKTDCSRHSLAYA